MDDTPDKDQGPTLLPPEEYQGTAPKCFNEPADIQDVRRADLELISQQFAITHAMFPHARSIRTVLALNKENRELIRERRAVMGLEYGSSTPSNSKKDIFEPLP